jgi:hypothetical protein
MHQDNQPHDENALHDLEIDVEALQRDLEYELVETLDYVAYSRDTTHLGIGGSREEALEELRKLVPDAQNVWCSRISIRIPRRPRRQESE